MKHVSKRLLCLVLALSLLLGVVPAVAAAGTASAAKVADLRVNDLIAPMGIDDPNPTFSWKMDSSAIGAAQTAYNIVVTGPADTIMWDTGWVESDDSVGIDYAGNALASSTEYTVAVKIKDQDGNETAETTTTFEMGLLEEDAFDDTSWIGYDVQWDKISDATVYNIDFDFIINDAGSDLPALGLCFGVQDAANLTMWQIRLNGDAIQFRPHMKVNGSWSSATANITSTLADLDITPDNIIGKKLHMRIEVNGTAIVTKIGNTAEDMVQVNSTTRDVKPLGSVAFRGNDKETASYDNIVITDAKGGVIYTEDFENTPLLAELIASAGAYKVADGMLTVGDGITSYSTNLTALCSRSVSELTSYSVDFDFLIKNKNMGICFGVEGTKDLTMWQFNLEKTSARFRPHFRTAGSWNTSIGMYLTGDQKPSTYWSGQKAHMRIVIDGSKFTAYVGKTEDTMTALFTDKDFSGTGWTSIPLKNIGFRAINNEVCYYDNIVVRDLEGNVVYEEDFSSTPALNALIQSGDDTAVVDETTGMLCVTSTSGTESYWILYNEPAAENNSLPAFRKSFTPAKEVASAKLYTSGLGVYESYINGQRVGNKQDDGSVVYDELKPGFTEPKARKFYSTYDVTWMLDSGENVLSAVVSSGWWSGKVAGTASINNAYLAKLIVTYTDGTQETIVTDTSWKADKAAALQEGTDIFNGERYDARVDQSWMMPGFDDSAWGNVKTVTSFTGEIVAWDGVPVTVRKDLERAPQSITVYEGATGASDGYYGTINVKRTYNADDAIVLNPGETLLVDFGQNFAGWEAFELEAEAGTTIEVQHGEMLNDGNGATSRGNDGPEGSIYNANYRTATANTIYIAGGLENESYHPSQSFYGFRYIEITADKAVTFKNITGQVVTSSQEDTGTLVTSDADVNQLVSNARWGMYSNYLSVPTDCPQRDERQGWTADTQNFAEAGCYLGFSKSFLEKWMQDMRDAQRSDGAYPSIAPRGLYGASGYGRVGWADAGIVVPYFLYVMYGDTSVIEENWDSMALFMDYRANNGIDRANNGKGDKLGYGDWLAYESNDSQIKAMLDISYYAWDALMMAEMAEAIGKTDVIDSYLQVYEEQKAYYQSLYLQEDGTLVRSEQSVNLYALFLDLLPDEESTAAVTEVLINNIEGNGNKLQTGFLGTEVIMHTLTKIGRTDVAYKLLLQHDNPSWLYSVDQGATTIWERWNSYTLESGFGKVSMNSFNHYSYGSVASWMFRGMAGIGWDEENPGFKHIILAPNPDRSLPTVKATYNSAYGEIVSNMSYDGNDWSYDATVPANTTATIKLPMEADDCIVTVNGKTPDAVTLAADGIEYVETVDNTMVFNAVAGSFSFTSHREAVEIARDAAQEAIDALSAYQNNVYIADGSEETVAELIADAKAAVAEFVAAEGDVSELENYNYIAGAEFALSASDAFNVDTYTIDMDITVENASAGFVFNYTDMNNLYIVQLNATNTNLRVCFIDRTNGSWNISRVTQSSILSADILDQQLHMQIAVDGSSISVYLGETAETMELMGTKTYSRTYPLNRFGPRVNTDGGIAEYGVWDNIVIKDADGDVIYSEDFSNPGQVVVNGSANAKYHTIENGVFAAGTEETASRQNYLLSKVNEALSVAAKIGDVSYITVQSAVNAADADDIVVLVADSTETVNVAADKTLNLDLNGYDLGKVVIAEGGKFYGLDSTTDNYKNNDSYGKIGTIEGDYAMNHRIVVDNAGKRYVAVTEEDNSISFHRFYVGITHMALRPGVGGAGYTMTLAGDEKVKSVMTTTAEDEKVYGYTVYVEGNEENGITCSGTAADFQCGIQKMEALTVDGILKTSNTADVNEQNAETVICVEAFVMLNGEKVVTEVIRMTFKDIVLATDAALNIDDLTDTQKAALLYLYNELGVKDMGWELVNIPKLAQETEAAE